MEKIYLTSDEAAQYLRMRRSRLYDLKDIPYYSPTGRKRLYKKEDLDRWVEAGKRNGHEAQ